MPSPPHNRDFQIRCRVKEEPTSPPCSHDIQFEYRMKEKQTSPPRSQPIESIRHCGGGVPPPNRPSHNHVYSTTSKLTVCLPRHEQMPLQGGASRAMQHVAPGGIREEPSRVGLGPRPVQDHRRVRLPPSVLPQPPAPPSGADEAQVHQATKAAKRLKSERATTEQGCLASILPLAQPRRERCRKWQLEQQRRR